MLDDQLAPAAPRAFTRSLGVAGVLLLTLSVATPASSVFVIVPGMLQVAGTGAVWALVIAGLVCVATAYVYAELSSAWPVAGGEYVMVSRTLGPLAGFVMLGINVFNNLLFPPALGLGISDVLAHVVPGLPPVPTAVAIIVASTLVAVLNIRVNAILTGIFLAIELVTLVVVTVLGLIDVQRPFSGFLAHPVVAHGATLVPANAAAIGVATSIAIFALNGYGAAVYFGEEMHDAPRRIARTVMLALVLTLLAEGVPMLALLLGGVDLATVMASSDPFGALVASRGGDTLAQWVAVGVAVAIVNAAIACILACARFFYGTARDRSWGRPLDTWMASIHPRLNSPAVATLLTGGAGVAACFLPLTLLLVLSGTGLVAIYAGISVAAIVGRRSGATAHAPYRMPLFPLAPLLTLAALAYVVWTSWLDPDEGRPSLIATAAQIVGSAAYYWLVLRRRGWNAEVPAAG